MLMTLKGEVNREKEGRRKGKRKGTSNLYVSQYLVGRMNTVAMLDPVKLSQLAKASTDDWTCILLPAPSPLPPAWGPDVM